MQTSAPADDRTTKLESELVAAKLRVEKLNKNLRRTVRRSPTARERVEAIRKVLDETKEEQSQHVAINANGQLVVGKNELVNDAFDPDTAAPYYQQLLKDKDLRATAKQIREQLAIAEQKLAQDSQKLGDGDAKVAQRNAMTSASIARGPECDRARRCSRHHPTRHARPILHQRRGKTGGLFTDHVVKGQSPPDAHCRGVHGRSSQVRTGVDSPRRHRREARRSFAVADIMDSDAGNMEMQPDDTLMVTAPIAGEYLIGGNVPRTGVLLTHRSADQPAPGAHLRRRKSRRDQGHGNPRHPPGQGHARYAFPVQSLRPA